MSDRKIGKLGKYWFQISLIYMVSMFLLTIILISCEPREGSTSRFVYAIFSKGQYVTIGLSFFAYLIAGILLACRKDSEDAFPKQGIPNWMKMLALVLAHGLLFVMLSIFSISHTGGDTPTAIFHEGKILDHRVNEFEESLSSAYIEGVELSLTEYDFKHASIGKPIEKPKGYGNAVIYLYSFGKELESVYGKYTFRSLYVVVDEKTKYQLKVKLLETDVSKFTEAQARDFLETLAKNGGKE